MAKRAANLFKRGDIYYFRRVNPTTKKRETVSTGCKDLNQANRRKTEMEKEQNNNAFGWKEKTERVEAPTVDAWAREFRKTYMPKHKVQDSSSSFGQALRHAVDFFADVPIDKVTPHTAERLMAHLRAEGYAKGTLRTYHSNLRTVWNTAIRAKLTTTNPWDEMKMPRALGRKRVLKPHEQPKLLDQLEPMWQRAVMFVLLTGLRREELVTLRDGDVDFVQRQVRVFGKGEKTRYVPLAPEAAQLVREQITARDAGIGISKKAPVVKRIEKGVLWPYAAGTFYLYVSNAAERAGLTPELTAHDLRRTFGSRCAASGVPMKRLQEWMGHSDITITAEFYVHTDSSNDIEQMAALRASVAPAATVLQFKEEAENAVATKVVTGT